MKVGRLFLIAMMVGSLAVIGCGDGGGTTGGGGTGTAGSGGSGTAGAGGDPGGICVGGDCVDGSAEKRACEAGVTACRLTPIMQQECIEATVADNCKL